MNHSEKVTEIASFKTMNGISPFIIINERTPEPFDAINC